MGSVWWPPDLACTFCGRAAASETERSVARRYYELVRTRPARHADWTRARAEFHDVMMAMDTAVPCQCSCARVLLPALRCAVAWIGSVRLLAGVLCYDGRMPMHVPEQWLARLVVARARLVARVLRAAVLPTDMLQRVVLESLRDCCDAVAFRRFGLLNDGPHELDAILRRYDRTTSLARLAAVALAAGPHDAVLDAHLGALVCAAVAAESNRRA